MFAAFYIINQKKEENDKETHNNMYGNNCITGYGKSVCLQHAPRSKKSIER
jgi:hypothetical protein